MYAAWDVKYGGNNFASWPAGDARIELSILEALELIETKVAIESSKRAPIAFSTGTMHSFTTLSPYIWRSTAIVSWTLQRKNQFVIAKEKFMYIYDCVVI